jgi:hypothetical protein
MNRTSGLGPTISGLVLIVGGAVLRYARPVHVLGLNVTKAGDLCLVVGLALAAVSLVVFQLCRRSGPAPRPEHRAPAPRTGLPNPYAPERDELRIP